ncbi:Rab geranylgeranyltransferase [Dimargaris cristalligena]|nr:Rab geranylgeranyltransferase [Dimargaris cristalligena]
MSHGVRRVKTTAEVQLLKKQKEAKLIDEYRQLTSAVFQKRKDLCYDDESFQLTTRLLRNNPELYTVWNYRREILLSRFDSCSEAEVTEACQAELDFFMEVIRFNPKCYWIWNHRLWALSTTPSPNWDMELRLVGKMLELDSRNFHGWDYRRYVIDKICSVQPENILAINTREFDYTTQKIMENFSNFSAWHNRLKLLEMILPGKTLEERRALIANEFELVQSALFTEPQDECGWLHWRWLIEQEISLTEAISEQLATVVRETDTIAELLELAPDGKCQYVQRLAELDPLRVGLDEKWW